ncbi:MAG: hypothetical protein KBC95_04360 [Candidatus Peribacteraceae bacterium]|nr:hypothetical protein [Candidatus Peribacteraceae bacterium]
MKRSYLFPRALLGGVAAGLATAVLAWGFDLVMDMIGISFVPFGFAGHLVVGGFVNLLGIIPLYLLGRFMQQPVPAYFTLVFVAAVAVSVLVSVAPPYATFYPYVAVPGILVTALASAGVATQIAYRNFGPEAPEVPVA